MLLLLRRLLLGIATFQDWPALRLGHRWHLLTRMRLLQIPRNVSTGHSRRLVTSAHLLVVRLRLLRTLGTSQRGSMQVSISHVMVRNLRWGTLRLAVRWWL